MHNFTTLAAALALTAAGCTRAPAPLPNQADYLPLAEGNEWYMDAAMVSSAGEVKNGTAHRILEETVKQDGHTYLRSRNTIEFPVVGKQEYTKLMRKDEAGLHAISEQYPGTPEENEIPLPLTVGHEWERKEGPRTFRNRVVGVETVEIGGVVFKDCCHIHSEATLEKLEMDFWRAPKVGNIRSVNRLPDGTVVTIILHEFKPRAK